MNVIFKIRLISLVSVVSACITCFASVWNFLKCYVAQDFVRTANATVGVVNNDGTGMTPALEELLLKSVIRSSIIVAVVASIQIVVSSCLFAASKQDIVPRWKFWTAFATATQIVCMVCFIAPARIYKQFYHERTQHLEIFALANIYFQGLGFYLAAHILLVISAMLVMRVPNDYNYKSLVWT